MLLISESWRRVMRRPAPLEAGRPTEAGLRFMGALGVRGLVLGDASILRRRVGDFGDCVGRFFIGALGVRVLFGRVCFLARMLLV
mgnify:CR=1 FL=1